MNKLTNLKETKKNQKKLKKTQKNPNENSLSSLPFKPLLLFTMIVLQIVRNRRKRSSFEIPPFLRSPFSRFHHFLSRFTLFVFNHPPRPFSTLTSSTKKKPRLYEVLCAISTTRLQARRK